MNYQHHYHAGNAADCIKHLALVLTLQSLLVKDSPLFFLDTHGGAGRYRLQPGGEHEHGIQRLWAQRRELGELRPWLDLLGPDNGRQGVEQYLGSPALALALLRPGDRGVFCETVPAIADALKAQLGDRGQLRREDGYQSLNALLPPREGRGLVLIDPPFEQADEWERLAQAVIQARARWPQGTFLIWYPIKIRGKITRLWTALQRHFAVEVMELLQAPESGPERLVGSGLLLLRSPWGLRPRLTAALSVLGPLLAERPGADPSGEGYWSLRQHVLPQTREASGGNSSHRARPPARPSANKRHP